MTDAGTRNLAAEVRSTEEGHQARLSPDDRCFLVVSDTQPGVTYEVTATGWVGGTCAVQFSCTCKGGQRRTEFGITPCKHAARVAHRLEREGLVSFDGRLWQTTPKGIALGTPAHEVTVISAAEGARSNYEVVCSCGYRCAIATLDRAKAEESAQAHVDAFVRVSAPDEPYPYAEGGAPRDDPKAVDTLVCWGLAHREGGVKVDVAVQMPYGRADDGSVVWGGGADGGQERGRRDGGADALGPDRAEGRRPGRRGGRRPQGRSPSGGRGGQAVEAEGMSDLNPAATVGELRVLMGPYPDEMPIKVHLGWDLPIVETGTDDDGFILFAADDDVSTVNRAWLASVTDEPHLGLATTRELLTEIKARGEVSASIGEYEQEMGGMAIGAAQLLDSLPGSMLDYKTVGDE